MFCDGSARWQLSTVLPMTKTTRHSHCTRPGRSTQTTTKMKRAPTKMRPPPATSCSLVTSPCLVTSSSRDDQQYWSRNES